MTSMRMRLLFSLSFVHVLVGYIGGEGGGVRVGGGVMTPMRMRLLFFSCVHVLVRYIGGDHANATVVFSFFFHLVLISSGAVHM